MAGSEANYGLSVANYFPIWIPAQIVVDAFVMEVTTVEAGGEIRAAIYNADSNYQPTTLVANSDISPITTTAGGVKTGAMAADVTLAQGNYLIWTNCNGNTLKTRAFPFFPPWYPPTLAGVNGGRFTVAQAYGAAPSTGLAWTAQATAVFSAFLRIKTP